MTRLKSLPHGNLYHSRDNSASNVHVSGVREGGYGAPASSTREPSHEAVPYLGR